MNRTEEFHNKLQSIPDQELSDKCSKALSELCASGGKSFVMHVPPQIEDLDMLFAELIRRFNHLQSTLEDE